MRREWQTVAVLTCGLLARPTVGGGGGGSWVEFQDHTSFRLNPHIPNGDTYGKGDTEEKDYAWGDVDMDGDIDLVVVRKLVGDNSIGKSNRLFLNEDGVLMDRTDQYATNTDEGGQGFNDLTADRDVALVDVNGDGWLDMVTAVAGAYSGGPKTITHPRVYINLKDDGGGNWLGFRYEEARIPQLVLTPNFSAVAYGDLTGDVRPDLYFTDYTNDLEDRLLINNGDGSFTDATSVRFSGNTAFLTSTFAPHAVIADLNGDGRNDIVKSDAQGPYAVKVTYNNGG